MLIKFARLIDSCSQPRPCASILALNMDASSIDSISSVSKGAGRLNVLSNMVPCIMRLLAGVLILQVLLHVVPADGVLSWLPILTLSFWAIQVLGNPGSALRARNHAALSFHYFDIMTLMLEASGCIWIGQGLAAIHLW